METAELGGVIAVILAIVVVVIGSRYRSRRKGSKTDGDA
jgi:hypothetical protein